MVKDLYKGLDTIIIVGIDLKILGIKLIVRELYYTIKA